jgi:dTDP-4-dehydrorhamnose 3,5-epimerase-like enzyme
MSGLAVEPLPLPGLCRNDLTIGAYWPLAVAELSSKDASWAAFATPTFAID